MGNADYFDWTLERVAELRRLWVEEGLSAGVIGRRWGVSRNAIIGKVHREGWQRGGAGPLERLKPGEAQPSGDAARVLERRLRAREREWARVARGLGITVSELEERRRQLRARKREPASPKALVMPLYLPAKRPAGPVSLLHLAAEDCRWVVGEVKGAATLFCGRRVERGSYCGEHAGKAYQRPRSEARVEAA